jgi:glycosyltransferase involved in cell wall biosynthesis
LAACALDRNLASVPPIRVLRVIDRMNVGGPALQATVLSRGLDPARFEQRLLVGSVGPDEGDYTALRAPDLPAEPVVGLGREPHARRDVRALLEISRVVREFKPHIVHTHKAKAGVLGRAAAWTHRVPATVHTFHGHLLTGYFSPAKTRAVVNVERTFAWRTTRLVAVGQQVRDELLDARVGRRDQYVVVPPGTGFPSVPSKAEARRRYGLPADAPVVTFVGRLTGVKRPERFVDAAIRLGAARPSAHFLVAGEGELLDEMRERARPLGDRIRFLGWCADVEQVYAASDVVMLTSDNEGMPVSLIEAAAVGVPAVTTRVGSAPEVVLDGVTGLVTTTDTSALVAATGRLLDDDVLRSAFGDASRRHASDHFGAARLVDDIARLYEEVVPH